MPRLSSFYSTYEELKLKGKLKNNKLEILFLQYLWGIETQSFKTCYTKIIEGFYSTYEELKHPNNHISLLSIFRFYSTYEELKQILFAKIFYYMRVFTVPMRNWNGKADKGQGKDIEVFTVPMRNWNIKAASLRASFMLSFYSTYEELKLRTGKGAPGAEEKFLQYLWGIETWTILLIMFDGMAFLQYLWGIETSFFLF